MMELSHRRHRFPPVVIQHAVWLYLRFALSYRDVEDLLAERNVETATNADSVNASVNTSRID
jgi:transposase-like protein